MRSLIPLRLLRLAYVAAAIVTCWPSPAPLGAQEDAHPLARSYSRARQLLDAAVRAHGGVDALRRAEQVRVELRGHDRWRNQSRAVAAFDSLPHAVNLSIDLARARLSFEGRNSYPGGARRAWRYVTDGARGYRVDLRAGTYEENQYPPARQQPGNLFYLPQHILLAALTTPAPLRYLGRMQLSSGVEVEAIATPLAGGQLSLAFDATTGLLRATFGVWSDVELGDVVQETEFPAYRAVQGTLMPTRRVSWVGGQRTRDLAYVDTEFGYRMPDSLAAPPAGSTRAAVAPAFDGVRTLADGVWLVGDPGAAALAVAFRDHVVVVDAPVYGSDAILQRIATLAPGKPVRYVIPTHHHDDHAGGVKHFAAAGATIVTTSRNRAFLERLATARTTVGADLAPLRHPPAIDVVDAGRRVFTDGERTLELRDVGAGPHAEQMFVAWLPREQIIYQADLIDVGADGLVRPGMNNETTMHFADWLRTAGVQPRVFAGTHGTLPDATAFATLIAQPIAR